MKKRVRKITPIADKMDEVRLSDEETAEIRALDKNVASILTAIGDHEVSYVARKNELLQGLTRAQQSLTERAQAIAGLHGLGDGAGWNLDIVNQAFTKKS